MHLQLLLMAFLFQKTTLFEAVEVVEDHPLVFGRHPQRMRHPTLTELFDNKMTNLNPLITLTSDSQPFVVDIKSDNISEPRRLRFSHIRDESQVVNRLFSIAKPINIQDRRAKNYLDY